MKKYDLACVTCHNRRDYHGTTPPIGNVQTCVTARAIRGGCKDYGCEFVVVEYDGEITDIDALRLGLREDRV